MTTSSLSRARIGAWRNALFVVFALNGLAFAGWAARVPVVAGALDLDTAQVGILLFGLAIGSIAGLLASSHLVATFGSRPVMLVTLVVAPLGLTAAAISATVFLNFAVTFIGLMVFGASIGTCDVAMNVSGAANERAIGRAVMPVYHAFFSVGTIIGAGLGALAEALSIPLAVHIGTISALGMAASVIVVRFLEHESDGYPDAPAVAAEPGVAESQDTEDAHARGTWRSRLAIWRQPSTLLIGLVVLGMAFAEGSANDWLSYAMVEGHGTDKPTGAVVFGVFVTAMTVGRLAGVPVLDRFGRVPVLRWSAVLAAAGLLLLIFSPLVWLAVVGVVFWGLGASLGFPVGMSAAADDPRTAAARVSAVATIGYVAFLVGPPAIGFLGAHVGILNGLLLVLALVAMAGLASSAAREPRAADGLRLGYRDAMLADFLSRLSRRARR
jgi:MFS family permease